MILTQIVVALIVVTLTLGPFGRLSLEGLPMSDLVAVSVWAFAWFAAKREALRYALVLGLMMDLMSFSAFGVWTIRLVISAMLISLFKQRFAELSSAALAILSLIGVTLLNYLANWFIFGDLDLLLVVMTTATNVILAIIVFYVLALRYKLLQKWLGKQI